MTDFRSRHLIATAVAVALLLIALYPATWWVGTGDPVYLGFACVFVTLAGLTIHWRDR